MRNSRFQIPNTVSWNPRFEYFLHLAIWKSPKLHPCHSLLLLSKSPLGFLLSSDFFWEMSLPPIECIHVTDDCLREWKSGNPSFKVSGTVPMLRFLYELCSTLVRFFFPLVLFFCLFSPVNGLLVRNMCTFWMLRLGWRWSSNIS